MYTIFLVNSSIFFISPSSTEKNCSCVLALSTSAGVPVELVDLGTLRLVPFSLDTVLGNCSASIALISFFSRS